MSACTTCWACGCGSRPTTAAAPSALSGERNLVVFRDVVTQAAVTRKSVPLILTRGTIEDEQRTAREKSIVSVFHEAGFATYWLSTQARDPFTGAINPYPREADVPRFYERRYDSQLVASFRELLAEGGSARRKQFFVIHTLGSHFNEVSRYPRSFDVFPFDRWMAGRRVPPHATTRRDVPGTN